MAERLKWLVFQPTLWASRLVFLLGPFLCLLMVEALNESDPLLNLSPLQFVLNLAWYFCLFILARIITRGNRRACLVSVLICFATGLLNHYILRFRGRVLWPGDLNAWRTALNVAGVQDYSLDGYIVLGLMVLVVYLILIVMAPSCPKDRAKLRRRSMIAGLAAVAVYVFIFFCTGAMPALNIYPHQWDTRGNGFVLNFALAARNMTFSEPEGYDRDRILELAEEYPGTAGDAAIQPENIIVIMNESFGDFSVYDRFSASQDPLPFLHSLEGQANTITGTLLSPAWRGGTATVEHEFLTGFNSAFQPPYTVAYQLYVHKDTPSMAEAANAAGYETVAFHPYLASGWNRTQVYDFMGFDRQFYQEDVEDPEYIRDYISDASDYETITRLTEEIDGKAFIFNITMQNHNGYGQEWTNLERTIELPEEITSIDPEAEQYFAALYESDKALEELISYYQESGEKTMIVFFGDHQPPLATDLYAWLTDSDLNTLNPEAQKPPYEVPFFIWTNYDIGSQTGLETSPAGLGAMTTKLAGLPMTGLQEFVEGFQEAFTGVLPIGLVRADGSIIQGPDEMTEAERQMHEDYDTLTYCGLMDQFEGTEALFHPDGQNERAPG